MTRMQQTLSAAELRIARSRRAYWAKPVRQIRQLLYAHHRVLLVPMIPDEKGQVSVLLNGRERKAVEDSWLSILAATAPRGIEVVVTERATRDVLHFKFSNHPPVTRCVRYYILEDRVKRSL